MAKQDNGFLGGFSGRLGTAVGYQWRGKWCVRSLPGAMANPRTEAQQAHREMFKQEVQLAGRMNWALRETLGAISLEMGLTAGNLFVKSNQHAFAWSDGRLAVDWASLVLSAGPVAPVRFGVPTVSGGTTLTVGFEKNPLHGRAENYDRVYVYVYCPTLEKGYLTAPEYRRTQSVSAVLPEMFAGREVQLWGMVQDAQGRWSETLYIGSCIVAPEAEMPPVAPDYDIMESGCYASAEGATPLSADGISSLAAGRDDGGGGKTGAAGGSDGA